MKILHVSDHLPGVHKIWGGAEQSCLKLIELLNSTGRVESAAITLPPTKGTKIGFPLYPVSPFERFLRFRLPFDPATYWQTRKIINSAKPQLMHLHRFTLLSFAALSAAKKAGLPVIMSVYDYWLFCPQESLIDAKGNNCQHFHDWRCTGCVRTLNPLKLIFLLFRKKIFARFLRQIDAFIALSNSSKELLVRFGVPEEKIVVIRLPYNVEQQAETGSDIEPCSLLLIGWIQSRKGQLIILKALKQVVEKFPQTKLYIIGKVVDTDYKNALDKFISKNGLSSNIFFLGRVSEEMMKERYLKAQIIVVPEQWENMSPVVVLEGMIKQKLLIASRIGGIPEFIEDGVNGLLATPNEPGEFAEKIIWVFKNDSQVRQMTIKAKQDILKICDQQKILDQWIELYESKR